jgi:DNA-binding transcriptional LysR family regulator
MISADQIRHRLKLRHLNVLLAVAEHGSMIKAAQQLAVSQPVVSKAIADLEQTLGVRLLERGQRGVEPTSYGRALLRRSIAIFDDLRASVRELEFLADPTTGELRIGSTEAMGTSLVPMIIEQMSKAYPRIRFELVMADPVTLRERELRGRRVDLVIGQRITPGFDTDDLNVTVLFNDRLRIVAAKSNPWAARRKIALADLIGDRWCLPPPSHPVGALVHEAFRRRKLPPPQPVVEAQTAPFTCSLVAGGQYLGVLGLVFLGAFDRLAAIKVLPVDLPIGEWPVSILTLRKRAPNPVTRLFVDHAQEVVRSLATKRR